MWRSTAMGRGGRVDSVKQPCKEWRPERGFRDAFLTVILMNTAIMAIRDLVELNIRSLSTSITEL